MPPVPARAAVVAALCAAMAAFASSSATAQKPCEIAGTYQVRTTTAKGSCPAVDITLEVGKPAAPCAIGGKARYNQVERTVACTRFEFDRLDGYTLEGSFDRFMDQDPVLGFSKDCSIMRLQISMQTGSCEIDLKRKE